MQEHVESCKLRPLGIQQLGEPYGWMFCFYLILQAFRIKYRIKYVNA